MYAAMWYLIYRLSKGCKEYQPSLMLFPLHILSLSQIPAPFSPFCSLSRLPANLFHTSIQVNAFTHTSSPQKGNLHGFSCSVLLCIIDTFCFPLWPERSVGVVRGEVNNPFSCVYVHNMCLCFAYGVHACSFLRTDAKAHVWR